MVADLAHALTEELERDPQSLAFLRLADLLRRQCRLDEARAIALSGLERHPYLPDAHDVLARILVDTGDEGRARDEWEMALRLQPSHAGALKGLGFLASRRGDLPTAERLLSRAVHDDPGDPGLVTAWHQIRSQLRHHAPPGPHRPARRSRDGAPSSPAADPRALFASLLGDGDRTALLLDRDGLVLAGAFVDAQGRDAAEEIGAQLGGLADEAARALSQLQLGHWEALLVESQHATVAMGPAAEGSVVLVAAARDSQVGFVRRLLARAERTAAAWLESAA